MKRLVYDKCSSKVQKQVDELGWPCTTYEELFRRLMSKDYYVMPLPLEGHKWEVGIVILGKANRKDNLMNRVSVAESLESYDEAMITGIEAIVGELAEGFRMFRLKKGTPEFEEYVRECVDSCREEGLID